MVCPTHFLCLVVLFCSGASERIGEDRFNELVSDISTVRSSSLEFPWHLPGCLGRPQTLTPDSVRRATDVKKSGSGNSGGVYFLALEQGCILVAKPAVDLHDLFALALGRALGAPVVKPLPVMKGDALYAAIIDGVAAGAEAVGTAAGGNALDVAAAAASDQQSFMDTIGANNVIQLLDLAPGKDLYDFTKGWDFHGCEECADEVATDATAQATSGLHDQTMERVLFGVRDGAVSPFYKGFVDEVKADTKFEYGSEELEEAVKTWMLEHQGDRRNPLKKLKTQIKRERKKQARLASTCAGKNGAEKEDDRTLQTVSAYVRSCIASDATVNDLASLSAFASIVGENDGFPTLDSTLVSNMHNLFVSPEGATGIDIAVGGAMTHKSVRADGTGGQVVSSDWKPFFLSNIAASGKCHSPSVVPSEEDALASAITKKFQRPFFNGDIHKYAKRCLLTHGQVIDDASAHAAADSVSALVPKHMANYLGRATDELIARVASEVQRFDVAGENDKIVGYLKHRLATIRSAFTAARKDCATSE